MQRKSLYGNLWLYRNEIATNYDFGVFQFGEGRIDLAGRVTAMEQEFDELLTGRACLSDLIDDVAANLVESEDRPARHKVNEPGIQRFK